jgi:hypothetical protein
MMRMGDVGRKERNVQGGPGSGTVPGWGDEGWRDKEPAVRTCH